MIRHTFPRYSEIKECGSLEDCLVQKRKEHQDALRMAARINRKVKQMQIITEQSEAKKETV